MRIVMWSFALAVYFSPLVVGMLLTLLGFGWPVALGASAAMLGLLLGALHLFAARDTFGDD